VFVFLLLLLLVFWFLVFLVLKDCDPVSDLLILTNFFAESRYKRY
jgi:hypothetical protein